MGGLVCRMLRARHRTVVGRLVDRDDASRGGRLVMLGTPSLGSLSIVTALTAQDKMVRWLARLDLRNNLDELQQVVASFPGAYQLLPSPDLPEPDSDHARLYDAGHLGDEPGAAGVARRGTTDPRRVGRRRIRRATRCSTSPGPATTPQPSCASTDRAGSVSSSPTPATAG